jgi:hypothetical protein
MGHKDLIEIPLWSMCSFVAKTSMGFATKRHRPSRKATARQARTHKKTRFPFFVAFRASSWPTILCFLGVLRQKQPHARGFIDMRSCLGIVWIHADIDCDHLSGSGWKMAGGL